METTDWTENRRGCKQMWNRHYCFHQNRFDRWQEFLIAYIGNIFLQIDNLNCICSLLLKVAKYQRCRWRGWHAKINDLCIHCTINDVFRASLQFFIFWGQNRKYKTLLADIIWKLWLAQSCLFATVGLQIKKRFQGKCFNFRTLITVIGHDYKFLCESSLAYKPDDWTWIMCKLILA